MPKSSDHCAYCDFTNRLVRKIVSLLTRFYLIALGRPSMQRVNDVLFKLALRGKGYNNCCSLAQSGELAFLKILAAHQPKICIDVGANMGEYSEQLLKLTQARVIAFEPLPKAHQSLLRMQRRYPERFLPINKGVGDSNKEMPLYFGDEESVFASLSSEVNQIDYVGSSNKKAIHVSVVTLDSYIDQPELQPFAEIDLIKVDTEGFEYEVLAGAERLIQQKKPKFIQIEYNWHQLFRHHSLFQLSAMLPGYRAYRILPYGSCLTPVSTKMPESNLFYYSNFVFVRDDIRL